MIQLQLSRMQSNTRIKVRSYPNQPQPQVSQPQNPQNSQNQRPILSFSNGTTITIVLYILTLLFGTLNVGIIGYNFGYYKVNILGLTTLRA